MKAEKRKFELQEQPITDRHLEGKVKVPSHFTLTVLAYKPPENSQGYFSWKYNDDFSRHDLEQQAQKCISNLKNFQNTFTGFEIEILVAVFSRLDSKSLKAKFKSKYELIKIAKGEAFKRGKASSKRQYLDAFDTCKKPHDILETDNGKTIFTKVQPIKEKVFEDPPKHIEIEIDYSLAHYFDSFNLIPLGIAKIFRDGGIKRVYTHHVKLYLWLVNRLNSGQTSISLDSIYNHTGLIEYFKQRNGHRACKIVEKSFEALKNVQALINYEYLSKEQIKIEPNKFHFIVKKKNKKRGSY